MKIMSTAISLINLLNRGFKYVVDTSQLYHIDESHVLKHSMEVYQLHRPKRKMRQTFYKNKNFVILLLNSVKAPYRALDIFDNYISVMVSLFYWNLYSLLYFSGLSPVSIKDWNTFWIFLQPFLSRLIHPFLLFSI